MFLMCSSCVPRALTFSNLWLDGLMQGDAAASDNKILDRAWRGVEATELLIATHELLYAGEAKIDAAMKHAQVYRYTCIYIRVFEREKERKRKRERVCVCVFVYISIHTCV